MGTRRDFSKSFTVALIVLVAGVMVYAAWAYRAYSPQADASAAPGTAASRSSGEPWAASDVLSPAEAAKTLSEPAGKRPLVVCVGFHVLYEGAHIPGASYHGPAGSPEGLANLKEWARDVPRDRAVVLYCGCCPWQRCPNIRPAYQALHAMGFTHLKVVSIPTDFATDWVDKGFPVEKAK